MKLTEHIYLVGSGCFGISAAGDCNVYAVESEGEVLLIDCGLQPNPERILANLQADGLNPEKLRGVVLTHVHPDHAGAAAAFRGMGVPIIGTAKEAEVLQLGIDGYYGLTQCLPHTGFRDFFCSLQPAKVDECIAPGESVRVGSLYLEAIPTPAHSPDSVCWLLRIGEKKHLFTGDTLFYPGQINYFTKPLSCLDVYPETIRTLGAIHPDGLYPGHALFTIDRAWECADRALACVEVGNLPPIKSYS